MGEPVNLPCQVNDKLLLEKVQKYFDHKGNITLGGGGVEGQSLRLLTTPMVRCQPCLWSRDAQCLGGAQPSILIPGSVSQTQLHGSLRLLIDVALALRLCATHSTL